MESPVENIEVKTDEKECPTLLIEELEDPIFIGEGFTDLFYLGVDTSLCTFTL